MNRTQKRQEEFNDYVTEELVELRRLIQQANSDHARERKELWAEIAELRDEVHSLTRTLNSRTEHLA